MYKIGISFKEDEKEMYDFLKSQLSPSIYVKQLLKEKMNEDKEIKKNNTNNFRFEV